MKLSSIVTTIAFMMLATAVFAMAQGEKPVKKEPTPDSLKADTEALKAAKVAWREIAWKSCL